LSAITIVRIDARSTGRITMRWIASPPANAITSVSGKAIHLTMPWLKIKAHAM
jgi:hypothetical protein